MERVKKGEKYWHIGQWGDILMSYEEYAPTDDWLFQYGNYFATKESAESMARKLRAVLKGAEVIEEGSIVIHTERCSDAQTKEMADAIADFLTEKFPDYAKTILN